MQITSTRDCLPFVRSKASGTDEKAISLVDSVQREIVYFSGKRRPDSDGEMFLGAAFSDGCHREFVKLADKSGPVPSAEAPLQGVAEFYDYSSHGRETKEKRYAHQGDTQVFESLYMGKSVLRVEVNQAQGTLAVFADDKPIQDEAHYQVLRDMLR